MLFLVILAPIAAYIVYQAYAQRDERPLTPNPAPPDSEVPDARNPQPDTDIPDDDGKSRVTPTMAVSANFYSTGQVWCFQDPQNCQHFGTDYTGPQGTPVFLPFNAEFLTGGVYTDAARRGDYVMFRDERGNELYFGHLQNTPNFQPGRMYRHGTRIGEMNNLNHVHVQLRIAGRLSDFERYYNGR